MVVLCSHHVLANCTRSSRVSELRGNLRNTVRDHLKGVDNLSKSEVRGSSPATAQSPSVTPAPSEK